MVALRKQVSVKVNVQCSVVWCGVVRCTVVKCGVALYGAVDTG